MNEATLEILQEHAQQLLGIKLEAFDQEDLKGITNMIKTPFTNTKRKSFKQEIKCFLQNMNSNKIYHYCNRLGINFLLFKFKKYKRIYIIGPYIEQRPNEQQCIEILEQLNIESSHNGILKQYLLKIPLCHHVKAKKLCRLAIQFLKNRNTLYEIEQIDFKFHMTEAGIAETRAQMDYTVEDLEYRYKLENQLLTAVEYGNVHEALDILKYINMSVTGLQRTDDAISNEQYKAFLLNTLCRKAIEKAGVNLIKIDELSSRYAKHIHQTKDINQINEYIQSLVIDYAEAAMKIKANKYSPKINKVVQYIESNLNQHLTLQLLAEQVNLAPSYLSRIFNQELHKSISQFILELRLQKGYDLIQRTKMSISEIAEHVGFSEQSYFTQCFKKYYGNTPLRLRMEERGWK
ncbi:AraC family transcriptional regulator [Staphylococcus gallinarum]|uniref:AraC family transcriptional regulator n=1 Tax=Staphylococcus gallinarum TaxID=1293 RepID=A0A3A0W8K8_STAGA|nr:AraC family transcriptional regulator [Staphylococcus gallinarum]RIP37258.1 AraC family transcriptional regulator [Staphylococcus gallinarum]